MEETSNKSGLSLYNRNALSLTGVKKVKSAEPACIVAVLDNCSVIISGTNLTVQNVSISSGTLDVTGLVTDIKYSNTVSRKFSLKNIFK